ncbi:hypothetical protein V3W47_12880 [Deinococcus sp. YIM 134068]|uniref:hypothetical protein n=1 Tax=Deinococcus lichenicola TaxID=3118910 RepID=UPI002F932606
MTGHTSDEQTDAPQSQRSTDSESATQSPTPQGDTVQDSPGTADISMVEEGRVDGEGNMVGTDDVGRGGG